MNMKRFDTTLSIPITKELRTKLQRLAVLATVERGDTVTVTELTRDIINKFIENAAATQTS
jgi:hypothetical protein